LKDLRIRYIDVARGLGIFLVIIGHLNTDELLHNLIYSFHMPFFFFLSGYLNNRTSNFKILLSKKLRTLIVPYFFFGLLSILIMILLKILTKNPIEYRHFEDFLRIFYYTGNPLPMNKVIWFLAVLFWVEVFNYVLKEVNFILKISFTLILGYLVAYCFNIIGIRIPFGLDILPMALCFFLFGLACRTYLLKYFIKLKSLSVFIIASIMLLLVNYAFPIHVDMLKLEYNNIFLLLLCFILGSISILSLSMLISRNKIIEFYGKNSLIVLGVHLILIKLLNVLGAMLKVDIKWYFQFSIIILLMFPIIILLNKYFSFFIGNKQRLTSK
jgi:fucose 4-O-acetylase-like acetyltransferase